MKPVRNRLGIPYKPIARGFSGTPYRIVEYVLCPRRSLCGYRAGQGKQCVGYRGLTKVGQQVLDGICISVENLEDETGEE